MIPKTQESTIKDPTNIRFVCFLDLALDLVVVFFLLDVVRFFVVLFFDAAIKPFFHLLLYKEHSDKIQTISRMSFLFTPFNL